MNQCQESNIDIVQGRMRRQLHLRRGYVTRDFGLRRSPGYISCVEENALRILPPLIASQPLNWKKALNVTKWVKTLAEFLILLASENPLR